MANLVAILMKHSSNDVVFIVGESKVKFEENRAFLAAESPVFEAMLYGDMKEKEQNANIIISDVNPDAFKFMIDYCRYQRKKPDESIIFHILKLADKYRMHGLTRHCDNYFRTNLNKDNFFDLLQIVNDFKLDIDKYEEIFFHRIHSCCDFCNFCQILDYVTRRNLTKHIETLQKKISYLGTTEQRTKYILKSEGFKEMGEAAMKIFVQSSKWVIKEQDLWEAVLKWKDHQIKDVEEKSQSDVEKELMKEICPFIRFGLMEPSYFLNNIRDCGYLNETDVNDILSYYLCQKNYGIKSKFRKCGKFSIEKRTSKEEYEERASLWGF